jgi:hypothetical protein
VGHPANERAVGQQPNDKARAIHIACVHPSGGGKQGRNESQVVGKEAAGEAGAERRYTSKPSCYASKPSCHTRVVLAASMRLSVTCLPNCEGGAPFYAVRIIQSLVAFLGRVCGVCGCGLSEPQGE